MRKFLDLLSLTTDLIRNNRKLLIPTIIGLIIAFVVISEIFILVESSQQNYFNEVVFNSPLEQNPFLCDISVEISAYYPDIRGSKRFTDFSHYDSLLSDALYESEFNRYIENYVWFSNPGIGIETPYSGSFSIDFLTCSSIPFFDSLEEYFTTRNKGRLPTNNSEIILVRPNVLSSSSFYNPFFHSLTVNSSITVTLPQWLHPYVEFPGTIPNKTLTIVGIIDFYGKAFQFAEVDPISQELTKYLNQSWTSLSLLTFPSLMDQTLNEIFPESCFEILEVLSSRQGIKHMNCKIYLNRTQFNAYQSSTEERIIENAIDVITEQFESFGYNSVVKSHIMNGIREYVKIKSNLIIMLFLVGAPVLAISFFLMIYSFELIKRQRKKQLSILKTRGCSWKQIVVSLYGEMIITSIAGGILSFLISIFLANLTLRSTDYIEFLGKEIDVRATIEIFIMLICIGITSTILLNFYRIIRLARVDIEETIDPLEIKNPFWKRLYLDILIFILGSAVWFSLIYLERSMSGSVISDENPLQIFFIIAPFLIFIGSILIIGRIFYLLIKIIGKIAWKTDWGIFPFSVQNIVRYRHAANRAALLLTLAVSFLVISSSLIFSIDATENLRLYCVSGGDLSIRFENGIDTEAMQIIQNNISHIESTSIIYTASATTYPGSGFTEKYYYHFLFIDSNSYSTTVRYFSEFQLSDSLSVLVSQMGNKTNGALFYSKNLEALEVSINSHIRLPIWSSGFHWNSEKAFQIVGTFNHWPNLFPNPSIDCGTNFWIIGTYGMYSLMKSWGYIEPSSVVPTLIIKADKLENVENIAESIESKTGLTPFVPALKSVEYKESFTRNFNLSILNSNIIISVSVATVCMIMFGFYIRIERGREIGIERALGVSREQIMSLFFIETSIIQIFGLIMGFITGFFFTITFLQITQLGALQTPFVITYPIETFPILIGVFIISELGILIPAYLASRTDISRILKVE